MVAPDHLIESRISAGVEILIFARRLLAAYVIRGDCGPRAKIKI